MDRGLLAPLRPWIGTRAVALALGLAAAACLVDEGGSETVEATVEVTGVGTSALSIGTVQWIDGTYGAGCTLRSGSWSVRVSGAAAMDYPALSVIKNNSACTLTVTSIVADQSYTASSALTMTGSYQATAAAFTSSATLTTTKDTYVNDGAGNNTTNYGTLTTMPLKEHGGASSGFNRNDWISFNTSGYSSITNAKLLLYVASVGVETTNDVPAAVYYAPTAADSWGETTLTWNNVPALPGNTPSSPIATQNLNNANSGTWVSYDVTSSVAADADGTATFVVSAWAGGDTNHGIVFSTKEGTNAPQLQLTYGPAFYLNADLSATTFASNFVVSILASDNPNLGTASATAKLACASSTPAWLTGFESGALSSAGATITPASSLLNTVSGAVTADQTVTRGGSAALEVAKTTNTSAYVQKTNLGSTPTVLTGRVAVRFQALPTATVTELGKVFLTSGANAVLGFNNTTSTFTLGYSGGTLRSGPLVTSSSLFNTTDWYHVVNATSGLCLDDQGGGAVNNNPVDQAACTSSTNMSWQFTNVATGVYQLLNQASGCVLNQGGFTTSGSLLSVYCTPSNTSTNLRWSMTSLGNGNATLLNLTSNMCADDPSGSTSAATQQDQVNCTSSTTNDMWTFVDQSGSQGGVVAGEWYRIDYRVNVASNPNTIDWQVNGVPQTQATMAQAATTLTGAINLGSTVSADRFTAWYDDVIVTTSSGDYPFVNGQVLSLVPASYAGKTDPSNFMKTNSGSNVSSTSYALLDDFPMTSISTYVQQSTGSATNYFADFGFGAVTNTSCINGVSGVAALHAAGSTADTVTTNMCYSGSCTAIHNDSVATAAIQYRSLSFGPPNGATSWTSTILSGTTSQIGYFRTGGGSVPDWDALMLEYDQAPDASTSYSSVVLADSPVSYWRLGELTGTTALPTAGTVIGTYVSSPTQGIGGMVGDGDTAVRFNGSSNYIDFGNNYSFTGTTAFSVEFWVNPSPVSANYPAIVSKFGSGVGWAFQLDGTSNGVAFTRYSSTANDYADSANGSVDLSPGTWYHVVGTYTSGAIKIYVNGILEDNEVPAVSIPTFSDTLRVGNVDAAASGSFTPFGGTVDELAIYNVVLSQARITAHYNAGKP